MARSHAIAVAIKQHAGEQARLRNLSVSTALGVVAGEPRLNHIPQLPIDYRRLFAGIGPFLVKRRTRRRPIIINQSQLSGCRDKAEPQPTLSAAAKQRVNQAQS